MKKTFLVAVMVLLSFSLSACDFFMASTSTTDTTTFLTSSSTTTTTSESINTTTTTTTTTVPATTQTTGTTASLTTTDSGYEPFLLESFETLQDKLDVIGIPSVGQSKVLVFAIDFSDYPSSTSPVTLSEINTAFNGTSDELQFESLRSYYQISSYGKLDIVADVYGYYRPSNSSSYYEAEYEKLWATDPYTGEWLYDDDEVTYVESDLIYDVMDYYDDVIDYSDYDSNGDGYIDGIYMIYNHEVSWTSGSDLWWAYEDVYMYENTLWDGVEPYYFVWSGAEFFNENDEDLNARTIIHETGHMLGLDDYYDYDDYDQVNSGGLGGADMMDSCFGDHNPFTKLALGWIHPWIVEGSTEIDLSAFEESGETILFIDKWNGTIFDEYLLISFYTPTGLNEQSYGYMFSESGVLIYHVSAQIGSDSGSNYFPTIFNYNNTDTSHKLIKIIEADMDRDIDNYSIAEDSDLFQTNDTLGATVYPTYKWYNNTALGATISITVITEDIASIEINVNN